MPILGSNSCVNVMSNFPKCMLHVENVISGILLNLQFENENISLALI